MDVSIGPGVKEEGYVSQDSKNAARQRLINEAVEKGRSMDLDQAIKELEDIITDDTNNENALNDPAIRCLGALSRVRSERIAKRKRTLFRWLVWFPLILLGLFLGGWQGYTYFLATKATGSYPVEQHCSIKFGDGEITGTRTYTFFYTSFLGYHLIDESKTIEKTVLNDTGTPFTILEITNLNAKTGEATKWKRQNVTKGGRGNIYLNNADHYTFVGQKDSETAMSSYLGLCKG